MKKDIHGRTIYRKKFDRKMFKPSDMFFALAAEFLVMVIVQEILARI